jgi:DNA integrity scanning protein DisA with diadenylate cyclase activity
MFGFYKRYFLLAIILFLTEVLIAIYMHDALIRPYGGDFLVVILIYCVVKSFADTPVISTTIGVLLFSYLIEISQYFHLVELLGWGDCKIARIVMGTYFCFTDLLCYTLGIGLVVIIEKFYGGLKRVK